MSGFDSNNGSNNKNASKEEHVPNDEHCNSYNNNTDEKIYENEKPNDHPESTSSSGNDISSSSMPLDEDDVVVVSKASFEIDVKANNDGIVTNSKHVATPLRISEEEEVIHYQIVKSTSPTKAGCKPFEKGFRLKSLRLPVIKIPRLRRSSLQLRWVILVLAMIMLLGDFYAYDIPAPLHQQLEDLMFDGSDSSFEVYFNLMYTVYSFPNIILPFIGGKYVDDYGAPYCLFVFAVIVWLGQLIFAIGAKMQR